MRRTRVTFVHTRIDVMLPRGRPLFFFVPVYWRHTRYTDGKGGLFLTVSVILLGLVVL